MTLSLPPAIRTQEEVLSISPKDREKYMEHTILGILRLNPQGATVTEITEATGLNRVTITKHLNRLVAIREAYKVERGPVSIYYKNGKISHSRTVEHSFANDKRYSFFRLINDEEKSVYIQEKETNSFGTVKVKGGIIIKDEDFFEFMKELQKFMLEVEKYESDK
ncbi:MarR family transcriptional regulator [Candidatus Bathyarchaeota archaeon]|nr:MarR family transcriptional regulator [Candidatus Bathyarchaeota archaeon]